uniref:Uncharacterized protein n=1 Tax=Timema monikensis TaxID=170555 RepID=A0A7R9E944_9NEOP|nr:unnamed protein product [Timema monikensis]
MAQQIKPNSHRGWIISNLSWTLREHGQRRIRLKDVSVRRAKRSEPEFAWRESGKPFKKSHTQLTQPRFEPRSPCSGSQAQHETHALSNYATEAGLLLFLAAMSRQRLNNMTSVADAPPCCSTDLVAELPFILMHPKPEEETLPPTARPSPSHAANKDNGDDMPVDANLIQLDT